MPLIKGKSEKTFVNNLKELLKSGKPKDQALAISYSEQKKAKKKQAKPMDLS